jgi:formate/nitrite transporter FocA (FNT family)
MAVKKPDEIAEEAVKTGVTKARTSWDKTLVASFLAGAYISFGALVAVTVSSGMDPRSGARCRPCSPGLPSPSGWSSC